MADDPKTVEELMLEAQAAQRTFANSLQALSDSESQLMQLQSQVSALRQHVETSRQIMRNTTKAFCRERDRLANISKLGIA